MISFHQQIGESNLHCVIVYLFYLNLDFFLWRRSLLQNLKIWKTDKNYITADRWNKNPQCSFKYPFLPPILEIPIYYTYLSLTRLLRFTPLMPLVGSDWVLYTGLLCDWKVRSWDLGPLFSPAPLPNGRGFTAKRDSMLNYSTAQFQNQVFKLCC